KWLEHDDSTLNTEKRKLVTEVPNFPPRRRRVRGFYAQDGHVKRIREALASRKPRHTFWANVPAQPKVRLPAVTEVELPTFDNSTLDGKWTYAAAFNAFGDIGLKVMYSVACPDK
ncbi:hypothetical protein CPB85DRAFT_1264165, partial [Mucidula mucida]